MNPSPGLIVVANNTNSDGVGYFVGSPDNQKGFASGTLDQQQSSQPIAVSGYEEYNVSFSPVGYESNTAQTLVASTMVTVDEGGDPTKVAISQAIL